MNVYILYSTDEGCTVYVDKWAISNKLKRFESESKERVIECIEDK